ncbi:hypothetical protein E2P81_ATG06560 [Venturia nashicola]|nr:hypothetical protein E2P81_ATG06560 [Venturia nashicola]
MWVGETRGLQDFSVMRPRLSKSPFAIAFSAGTITSYHGKLHWNNVIRVNVTARRGSACGLASRNAMIIKVLHIYSVLIATIVVL